MAALVLGAGANAYAVGYNIILKTANEVVLPCATAGFSFTKTTAGLFPVSAPSIVAEADCFGPNTPALSFPTNLAMSASVVTTSSVLPGTGGQPETLKNGPNVEGVTGAMRQVIGGATYDITFTLAGTAQPFTRNYTVERVADAGGQKVRVTVATGKYYVLDTTRPLPEPGTIVLSVMALGLLAVVGWSRRRRLAVVRAPIN